MFIYFGVDRYFFFAMAVTEVVWEALMSKTKYVHIWTICAKIEAIKNSYRNSLDVSLIFMRKL